MFHKHIFRLLMIVIHDVWSFVSTDIPNMAMVDPAFTSIPKGKPCFQIWRIEVRADNSASKYGA